MDITPYIPELIQAGGKVQGLMEGTSTVACFGSRALLSLFICAAPSSASMVGGATTEEEGYALVERLKPTFLFVSEKLEKGDGMGLVRRCHELMPQLSILMILQEETERQMQQALELGCNGVIRESRIGQGALIEAVRAVMGGGIYADQIGIKALRATSRGAGSDLAEPLSSRELEVLRLLVRGFTNREMATELYISSETIKTHVTNILSKLTARDRTHAAVIGLHHGLVSWEQAGLQ